MLRRRCTTYVSATLLDIDGKTKANLNESTDLKDMRIKYTLNPIIRDDERSFYQPHVIQCHLGEGYVLQDFT